MTAIGSASNENKYPLLDQGDDTLTLKSRLSYLAGYKKLLINKDTGKAEVINFLQPPVIGLDDKFSPEDFVKTYQYNTILDHYYQINKWLSNKKAFVDDLLSDANQIIDILWIISKDTEISIFNILKKRNKITTDINKILIKSDNSIDSKSIENLIKYINTIPRNQLSDERRNRFDGFIYLIENLKNKNKFIQEIVSECNSKYNLNLKFDYNYSNLDSVFWDDYDLECFIENDYKISLREKLRKENYLRSLRDWNHDPNQRPFIVRNLELKKWNYELFLTYF